jgi:hypothetical protein
MLVRVSNVIAFVALTALMGGSVAQAAPVQLEGEYITSSAQGANSLKSDAAKLVVQLDAQAKRYTKDIERMNGRSKSAGDKYALAAAKLKKLADVALKLKSEARSIKTAAALSKVRQKKSRLHQLASSIYLDLLNKPTQD